MSGCWFLKEMIDEDLICMKSKKTIIMTIQINITSLACPSSLWGSILIFTDLLWDLMLTKGEGGQEVIDMLP